MLINNVKALLKYTKLLHAPQCSTKDTARLDSSQGHIALQPTK